METDRPDEPGPARPAPVQPSASRQKPTVRYSFIRILTGSDLSRRRLAVMRARAAQPGPTIWLTACGHGDEVGGMVIIQEVFKRLRRGRLLCGEVSAFPLMNPLGFEMSSRQVAFSGEDLNRAFPGNPNGSLAQRIAHRIFQEITQTRPALVLDLHNDWRSSIPYAVLDPPPGPAHKEAFAKAKAYARVTGLLLIAESPKSPDALLSPRTLSGSLLLHGVPALTLELGEAYVVNEMNVRFGVRAIWNTLAALKMVEPDPEPFAYPLPRECRGRFLPYSDQVISSTSGIIRFMVRPGDVISAEYPVARTYNAFGKLLETITAPAAGIVLGHSDTSVAFPGVPIVAIGLI